jgi:hypothetical protein
MGHRKQIEQKAQVERSCKADGDCNGGGGREQHAFARVAGSFASASRRALASSEWPMWPARSGRKDVEVRAEMLDALAMWIQHRHPFNSSHQGR